MAEPEAEKFVVVLTTVGDDDAAESLAGRLVEERLAACVNVLAPMVSVYRWKGRVEHERERQLVIKTARQRLPALERRVRELHSYEVPEFVVLDVAGGSEAYLAWVSSETSADG
jgi:periplasmic divalent cation tolerance protein